MGKTQARVWQGAGVQCKVPLLLRAAGRRGWEGRAAWERTPRLASGRPVCWMGNAASPSEPTLSTPRAAPHQGRAGQGRFHCSPIRAVRSHGGLLGTTRNQPKSWPLCSRKALGQVSLFSKRTGRPSPARGRSLLKVATKQQKDEHCRNMDGNDDRCCQPSLGPDPGLSKGFILMAHPQL